MEAPEPVISESDFQSIVAATVGRFLESKGFRAIDRSGYRVEYAGPGVHICVDLDAGRSEQLELSAAPSGISGPPLVLSDLLRASEATPEEIRAVALTQPREARVLERELNGAVKLLAERAEPALAGDAEFYARAYEIRSARAAHYTASIIDHARVVEADDAWERKDLGRVHDLLNPIRDRLDETHRRRLTYAERRL